jgi:hypothetical protein
VPDEGHPWLTDRGTWGNIEALVGRWTAAGYRWVNLRFALDEDGKALVRYEARPKNEELILAGRLPAFNGGFDIHRLVTREEFVRSTHPRIREGAPPMRHIKAAGSSPGYFRSRQIASSTVLATCSASKTLRSPSIS